MVSSNVVLRQRNNTKSAFYPVSSARKTFTTYISMSGHIDDHTVVGRRNSFENTRPCILVASETVQKNERRILLLLIVLGLGGVLLLAGREFSRGIYLMFMMLAMMAVPMVSAFLSKTPDSSTALARHVMHSQTSVGAAKPSANMQVSPSYTTPRNIPILESLSYLRPNLRNMSVFSK